jgi:hypothetical protein
LNRYSAVRPSRGVSDIAVDAATAGGVVDDEADSRPAVLLRLARDAECPLLLIANTFAQKLDEARVVLLGECQRVRPNLR